ncbi:MAG: DNA ligase D [Myxococcales bacterium]|nr:DNA ligase D [Myxococcales bacterium]
MASTEHHRLSNDVSVYRPQLATLVPAPPDGDDWLHEIKYDGYRIGCRVARAGVRLLSRKGNDWTRDFPEVAAAARSLPVSSALLDGEIAVLLADGRTSFQALQNWIAGDRRGELVYFVFDALELDGRDLSRMPLRDRTRALAAAVPRTGMVRLAQHWLGGGASVLREACRLGFEGIVSKRLDSPRHEGRSTAWVKTKCVRRQEFVVGGFTESSREPGKAIGALLVGVNEAGKLRFAGKVGTGYTRSAARSLRARFEPLRTRECPFDERPPGWLGRNARWVKPALIAEVMFTEWTEGGNLRHPSFQGLREDKAPREVGRERPAVRGISLSHPERVVFPAEALSKLDLARYHDRVAERELPHLRGRPLTLLRCPGAIGDDCTFMKHSKVWAPDALRRVRIQEKKKLGEYLIADTPEAVLALVQMDVIEFHTWNTRDEAVELPDRIVIDLDPGPEVRWRQVVGGARLLRSALRALGLESFVKTTGGRGLHVVVPLAPERDWTDCLAFSRDLARAVERQHRASYTTEYAKAGREKKILIDYLRNNRTNTSIAAYSPRARPGAPVSVPIAWDELSARLDPLKFTVQTVPRLRADPWKEYWKSHQRLTAQALAAVAGL